MRTNQDAEGPDSREGPARPGAPGPGGAGPGRTTPGGATPGRPPRRLPGPGRAWLLALPAVALLWPGLYNRHDPEVFGLPFFYAYQLLAIPLAVGCMLLAGRGRGR